MLNFFESSDQENYTLGRGGVFSPRRALVERRRGGALVKVSQSGPLGVQDSLLPSSQGTEEKLKQHLAGTRVAPEYLRIETCRSRCSELRP